MSDEELVGRIVDRLTTETDTRLDDKLRRKLVCYAWNHGDLSAEELITDLLDHHRHDLSHEETGDLLAVIVCSLWWNYVPHPE